MERAFAFLFLAASLGFNSCTKRGSVESLVLDDWKFRQGDSLEFAMPDYEDSEWKTIAADRVWEEQGYDPYDGYAWFRTRIVIPSRLREHAFLKDSLCLFLGKINNYDQSFLNGELFGINGVNVGTGAEIDTMFITAPMELYNRPRRYTLHVEDPRIRWDRENLIAVRVYDEGGLGGLWSGDQRLAMINIKEYALLDHASKPFYFQKDGIAKELSLTNRSAGLWMKGIFSIAVFDKLTEKRLNMSEQSVELSPGRSKGFFLHLENRDKPSRIEYKFTFSETPETLFHTEEAPYILTPDPPREPQIHGARIFGIRPGKPFLYTIAATGEEPLSYSAEGLPAGLSVNRSTGIITGWIGQRGTHEVILRVRNRRGETTAPLRIEVGDRIALTPPMGWNSWNCWGTSVSQEKVLQSARAFVNRGLIRHGWTFINIDDGWEIKRDASGPKRAKDGTILVNEKFPDMKALGDAIHSMGLKFGIYSSPGPWTCGGFTGSHLHELRDAQTFASWGVDYLKYDWCSYEDISKDHSRPELMKPYVLMRDYLQTLDRDIVYSLCQYGMGKVWEWGAEAGGNLWRTTEDITDTWNSMSGIGFSQVENAPFAGPGRWNDPDMLVVGWVGWGPNLHSSGLTPDEQYTHISLWCLLSAPLLIGCDLERLDPFTLNLLTNDEVLALDQDMLGKPAVPIAQGTELQVWVKELADGSKAVGIFNLSRETRSYRLDLNTVTGKRNAKLRDLWRRKDLGVFKDFYEALIPSHGVILVSLTAEE